MKCQVDAVQWGGGGSSRIFPWSPKPTRFSGGGVVAKLVGVVPWIFSLWGPFTFLDFPKGGGPGPPSPPESAIALDSP